MNLSAFRRWRAAAVVASLALLPQVAHAQPRVFGGKSLQQIVGVMIRNVIGLMGTVSVAVFVYAGFLWMTAQGDDKQVAKAKSTLAYAVIGILVAFLSYAAVAFVLKSIDAAGTTQ